MNQLDCEKVLPLFGLFSGLPTTELELWKGLCQSTVLSLQNQLREDIDFSENKERLYTAAAAFAYADYLMLAPYGTASGEQIRVGDISVGASTDSNKRDSRSIRDYFTQQIGELLKAPDFLFAVVSPKEEENAK